MREGFHCSKSLCYTDKVITFYKLKTKENKTKDKTGQQGYLNQARINVVIIIIIAFYRGGIYATTFLWRFKMSNLIISQSFSFKGHFPTELILDFLINPIWPKHFHPLPNILFHCQPILLRTLETNNQILCKEQTTLTQPSLLQHLL